MEYDINMILGCSNDTDTYQLALKEYYLNEGYREILRYSDDDQVQEIVEKRKKILEENSIGQRIPENLGGFPKGEINGLDPKFNEAINGIGNVITSENWSDSVPSIVNALRKEESNIIYRTMAQLMQFAVNFARLGVDSEMYNKLSDIIKTKE